MPEEPRAVTPAESLERLDLPATTTEGWLQQLAEPHRHYHTLEHVAAMLAHSGHLAPGRPDAVTLSPALPREFIAAIWLHDIVYDPHAGDNEERSAEQAVRDLEGSAIDADAVAALIMATKRHHAATELERQLIDLDLGILGAAPAAYDRYARQIRMEYDFVPDDAYGAARISVLEGFDKRTVFKTPPFARLEAQAHENLRGEIQRLRG